MTTRIEFTILGSLPGLNEYTRANRANRYAGANLKAETEALIALQLPRKRFDGPVRVHFAWHERDRRRDPDNIRFAAKFVLDAMVKRGIIPNDSQRFIAGLSDSFCVGEPGVTVSIEPVSKP